MRKLVTLLLVIIFIAGCGTDKDNFSMLANNKEISKITIQYFDDYIDVTNKEDIEQIKKMFSDNKENDDEQLKDAKGWIYNLRFYDKKDNEIVLISILDENNVRFENKIYTCSSLSLTSIDEISEIKRK